MNFPRIEDLRERVRKLEDRARKILGLAEKAEIEPEKIKHSFRKMAKKYHPDLNPGERSTLYFRLVVQAKDYLSKNFK